MLRFATTDPGIECFTPEQVELMIRLATVRSLIRRAWTTHRWEGRPRRRP